MTRNDAGCPENRTLPMCLRQIPYGTATPACRVNSPGLLQTLQVLLDSPLCHLIPKPLHDVRKPLVRSARQRFQQPYLKRRETLSSGNGGHPGHCWTESHRNHLLGCLNLGRWQSCLFG